MSDNATELLAAEQLKNRQLQAALEDLISLARGVYRHAPALIEESAGRDGAPAAFLRDKNFLRTMRSLIHGIGNAVAAAMEERLRQAGLERAGRPRAKATEPGGPATILAHADRVSFDCGFTLGAAFGYGYAGGSAKDELHIPTQSVCREHWDHWIVGLSLKTLAESSGPGVPDA